MTQGLISGGVTWCSCSCRLFSFTEILVTNGILIAGYLGSRCLSTAAFVKETVSLFDSFNCVACNPHHCQLSRRSKHLEHWQSAVSKIKCSMLTHSVSLCIHSICTSHLVMRIWKQSELCGC